MHTEAVSSLAGAFVCVTQSPNHGVSELSRDLYVEPLLDMVDDGDR